MGMDPGTATLLSSLIMGGLGFAGGALQGNPPQPDTFANINDKPDIDPRNMLEDTLGAVKGAYADASQRAHRPVELPDAYVQDVPTFTGGGLPMPIGVSGHDPANANPDLRRIVEGQIGSLDPGKLANNPVIRRAPVTGNTAPGNTDITGNVPIKTQLPDYRSAVARRPIGQDLISGGNSPDDTQRAAGAIDLLRHALGQ